MAIYALMVVKNEADRYLHACLEHLRETVDGIAVFDDQSTDSTVQICRQYGCEVMVRNNDVPSFLEHEGRFRQAACEFAQHALELREHDWVLALDADEFLLDPSRDPRRTLINAVAGADGFSAISLKIHEVFGFDDNGSPLIRTDGYWDKISAPRLFRYQLNGTFSDKAMGCGSQPTYALSKVTDKNNGLYILHYGYAKRSDQLAKYERYSSTKKNGHNSVHIDSIVRMGDLQEFNKPYVEGIVV